jgi:hypothetical protein
MTWKDLFRPKYAVGVYVSLVISTVVAEDLIANADRLSLPVWSHCILAYVGIFYVVFMAIRDKGEGN